MLAKHTIMTVHEIYKGKNDKFFTFEVRLNLILRKIEKFNLILKENRQKYHS